MTPTDERWERALRAAMRATRELQPTDAEVQRVMAMDRDRRHAHVRPRVPALRLVATAACAIAVLSTGAYAVPVTRAAVSDLYGSAFSWLGGDGDQPGRAVELSDDAPDWVTDTRGTRRLVAENAGVKVYATRAGDAVSAGVGNTFAQTATPQAWAKQIGSHKLISLGFGTFPATGPLDTQGRRPLAGLSARSITRVKVRYTTGPSTSETGLDGGFVVLVDAHRHPTALIGYDAAGHEIDRLDLSSWEVRVCYDARGCPPGTYHPTT